MSIYSLFQLRQSDPQFSNEKIVQWQQRRLSKRISQNPSTDQVIKLAQPLLSYSRKQHYLATVSGYPHHSRYVEFWDLRTCWRIWSYEMKLERSGPIQMTDDFRVVVPTNKSFRVGLTIISNGKLLWSLKQNDLNLTSVRVFGNIIVTCSLTSLYAWKTEGDFIKRFDFKDALRPWHFTSNHQYFICQLGTYTIVGNHVKFHGSPLLFFVDLETMTEGYCELKLQGDEMVTALTLKDHFVYLATAKKRTQEVKVIPDTESKLRMIDLLTMKEIKEYVSEYQTGYVRAISADCDRVVCLYKKCSKGGKVRDRIVAFNPDLDREEVSAIFKEEESALELGDPCFYKDGYVCFDGELKEVASMQEGAEFQRLNFFSNLEQEIFMLLKTLKQPPQEIHVRDYTEQKTS